MLCEKCALEMEPAVCDGCGRKVILLGSFCYHCGERLKEQAAGDGTAPPSDAGGEADFESRILCSDGNCIGVVNERGICKVCGKPYTPEA